jgi:hypothetical protein
MGLVRGFVDEAIKVGDLDPGTSVSRVMFAIITMVIGTHTMTSSFCSALTQTGIDNPFAALRDNIHVLLDGFGWKPLSTEWDYAATEHRLIQEVFADEFQSARLG